MNAHPSRTYSASRLGSFNRCAKEYELKYLQGYRKPGFEAWQLLGSVWHLALEGYYRGLAEEVAAQLAEDAGREAAAEWLFTTWLKEESLEEADVCSAWAKVDAMLTGYFQRWGHGEGAWEILAVEQKITSPLEDGATFLSIPDLLIRNREDGLVYIVEHKTAADIGEDYWPVLTNNPQAALYARFVHWQGELAAGVIYNVTQKSRLRQGKAEDLDGYRSRLCAEYLDKSKTAYARHVLVFDERDITDAEAYVAETIAAIEGETLHRRNPSACRECALIGACNRRYLDPALTAKKPEAEVTIDEPVELEEAA